MDDLTGDPPKAARGRPFNSPLNGPLRRVELLFFCGLVFCACAAMAWRMVQFAQDGFALLPVTGLTIPWPAGFAAAGLLFALSAAIATATAAMLVRFFRS